MHLPICQQGVSPHQLSPGSGRLLLFAGFSVSPERPIKEGPKDHSGVRASLLFDPLSKRLQWAPEGGVLPVQSETLRMDYVGPHVSASERKADNKERGQATCQTCSPSPRLGHPP